MRKLSESIPPYKNISVYHGTPSDFDKFSSDFKGSRTNKSPDEVVFHFSSSPVTAKVYAKLPEKVNAFLYRLVSDSLPKDYEPFTPCVMECSLEIDNPMFVPTTNDMTKEAIQRARDGGHDAIIAYNENSTAGYEFAVLWDWQIEIIGKTLYGDLECEQLAAELHRDGL